MGSGSHRDCLSVDVFVLGYRDRDTIVATGLTKSFGDGAARMTAVDGVNFVAHFGEMIFVVGPSGSGKTTFLSMLSGILRPAAGTVQVKDVDIWQMSKDQLADFRLNTIGFVFQDDHLFPRLALRSTGLDAGQSSSGWFCAAVAAGTTAT